MKKITLTQLVHERTHKHKHKNSQAHPRSPCFFTLTGTHKPNHKHSSMVSYTLFLAFFLFVYPT
jgi:hypothetical protein